MRSYIERWEVPALSLLGELSDHVCEDRRCRLPDASRRAAPSAQGVLPGGPIVVGRLVERRGIHRRHESATHRDRSSSTTCL